MLHKTLTIYPTTVSSPITWCSAFGLLFMITAFDTLLQLACDIFVSCLSLSHWILASKRKVNSERSHIFKTTFGIRDEGQWLDQEKPWHHIHLQELLLCLFSWKRIWKHTGLANHTFDTYRHEILWIHINIYYFIMYNISQSRIWIKRIARSEECVLILNSDEYLSQSLVA